MIKWFKSSKKEKTEVEGVLKKCTRVKVQKNWHQIKRRHSQRPHSPSRAATKREMRNSLQIRDTNTPFLHIPVSLSVCLRLLTAFTSLFHLTSMPCMMCSDSDFTCWSEYILFKYNRDFWDESKQPKKERDPLHWVIWRNDEQLSLLLCLAVKVE